MTEGASPDGVLALEGPSVEAELSMPAPAGLGESMPPPSSKKHVAPGLSTEGIYAVAQITNLCPLRRAVISQSDVLSTDAGRQAAMSAAAEAASAAAHVTPAQRERAIAEAAAKVRIE